MKKLLESKDIRSALIASAGMGLGYVASQMATGAVPDWKALFVAAGSVAANRLRILLAPVVAKLWAATFPEGDD